MPVNTGKDNEGCFARWGKVGHKYHYECGNADSMKEAKKKAIAQGVASGDLEAVMAQVKVVTERYDFVGNKTSFDFDGVLTTRRGRDKLMATGGDVYIITARSMANMYQVYKVANELNVPRSRVISTGSNKAKIDKIKELGIRAHYDNNPDVIKQLPGVGHFFS